MGFWGAVGDHVLGEGLAGERRRLHGIGLRFSELLAIHC